LRAGAYSPSWRSGPLAPAREIRPWCICGDIASLPIKPASVDLVWSNLTLQWVGDMAMSTERGLPPGGFTGAQRARQLPLGEPARASLTHFLSLTKSYRSE